MRKFRGRSSRGRRVFAGRGRRRGGRSRRRGRAGMVNRIGFRM